MFKALKEGIKQGSIGELVLQGAMLSAVIVTAMPELAFAQSNGFGQIATNVTQNTQQVPNLISAGCYIAAALVSIAGAYKLKTHAENPSQTPMSHGLVRLAVGGGLAAIPTVLNTAVGSLFQSGQKLQYSTTQLGPITGN